MTSALQIANYLKGKKIGCIWMANCPAHDDRTPSLSISETKVGKVLLHCHAGCTQAALINALKRRGLWDRTNKSAGRVICKPSNIRVDEPDPDERKRIERALAIWHASLAIVGSLGDMYLRARAITMPLPNSLRFHPSLKHPLGDSWPAIVALVTDGKTRIPTGIHRTFLARNGQGKALVANPKMMLGRCRGGVVRFGECRDIVMVGEGIETCLSAMQSTGKPEWAALSTSGLLTLELPSNIQEVTILEDGDPPGEKAARHTAMRWQREALRVRIAHPTKGMDFNDMLKGNSR